MYHLLLQRYGYNGKIIYVVFIISSFLLNGTFPYFKH